MEELSSPVKHRLELLERTVYALQAQQRLLEYRIQYAEDENQILRQHVTSKITEIDGSDIKKTSTKPSIQTLAPNFPSIPFLEKGMSSLSLLDAPNLLSTPTLTPARIVPTSNSAESLGINFHYLTPTSTACSELDPTEGSQKDASHFTASTLISVSSKSDAVKDTLDQKDVVQPILEDMQQKFTVIPWDGTIAWKFIRLFKDKKEEHEAMLNSIGECDVQDEWFFQYGLRYIPKPNDKDAYRTVRIENLPKNATLTKLLAEIHYGDVFSAEMLDTSSITGYHTARVVFLRQQSALKFCKYVKRKGLKIQGVRAHVTVEKTATYPVGMSLRDSVWDYGCTRCLTIAEVPTALLQSVEGIIHGKYVKDSLERYHREDSDVLEQGGHRTKYTMRFYSMRAASIAHKEFRKNIFLRNCIVKYEKDPCNSDPL